MTPSKGSQVQIPTLGTVIPTQKPGETANSPRLHHAGIVPSRPSGSMHCRVWTRIFNGSSQSGGPHHDVVQCGAVAGRGERPDAFFGRVDAPDSGVE